MVKQSLDHNQCEQMKVIHGALDKQQKVSHMRVKHYLTSVQQVGPAVLRGHLKHRTFYSQPRYLQS
jgi:hypothetical protein